MKKIFLTISALFLFNVNVLAQDWNSETALARVNSIGNKLLNSNGVQQAIEIKVSEEEDVNAYANINKEVYVYKGLLENVSNDEELAAVISHEVGHILNGHCAKQGILNTGVNILAQKAAQKYNATAVAVGQQLTSSKLSRNDEFEADLTGVDLLVKAGYNPMAMISVLNKICGNYIDILQTHPSGEKRLMNIYNYIEYNYPAKIKTGFNSSSYTKAMLVISPNVQKRKTSEKLTKKFEKEQKKLLSKKEKRMKKMAKTTTIWDGYYSTLMLMAQ